MILGVLSQAVAKVSLSILQKSKNFNFYDSNNKSKETDDKNSSLLLKPSEHLKHLVNQF